MSWARRLCVVLVVLLTHQSAVVHGASTESWAIYSAAPEGSPSNQQPAQKPTPQTTPHDDPPPPAPVKTTTSSSSTSSSPTSSSSSSSLYSSPSSSTSSIYTAPPPSSADPDVATTLKPFVMSPHLQPQPTSSPSSSSSSSSETTSSTLSTSSKSSMSTSTSTTGTGTTTQMSLPTFISSSAYLMPSASISNSANATTTSACGQCSVAVDQVRVYYWPTASVRTDCSRGAQITAAPAAPKYAGHNASVASSSLQAFGAKGGIDVLDGFT